MRSALKTLTLYLEKTVNTALWFTLALALLVALIQLLAVAGFPYMLDYGEGPLLDQAVRIRAGERIYAGDITQPPYTISNYPPVYPALLALFNSPAQASLLPGRLVSLLATLGTAFLLYQMVRLSRGDHFAGITAAIFFLAFPYVVGWGGLMRVDNLALLFAAGALFVSLRWRERPISLWLTAVLLTLAAYTRQSYLLAAPLACGVYWLFKDWRRALQLALVTLALVAALFGLLMLTSNGGFYQHVVVANQNAFQWETVSRYLGELTGKYLLASLLAGLFLLGGWRLMDEWKLAAPFLLGAGLSALMVGKIGSNINYLLELSAAISLAIGLLFSWLRSPDKPVLRWLNLPVVASLVLAAFGVGLMWQLSTSLHIVLTEQTLAVKDRRDLIFDYEYLENYIKQQDDPILLTEQMALLPINGKQLYFQPFEMTQLSNDGIWDQTPFLEEITAQRFSMIALHPWDGERWTPEMRSAIYQHYRASRRFADSTVFLPVPPGEANALALPDCQPVTGWQVPARAEMGTMWYAHQIYFLGSVGWGDIPVYAAADGLLFRFEGWQGAVAIQHDDPLNPGQKVWTYYGDMRHPWNGDEYVVDKFPPGAQAVAVKGGELIGFQGSQPGSLENTPHLHFAIVPAAADGFYPDEWLGLPEDARAYLPPSEAYERLMLRHVGDYLGIMESRTLDNQVWLPYGCPTGGE